MYLENLRFDFQVKLNNVINKRTYLEDLIWKGSVLPNKYKFVVRSEIRLELQKLDERWTKLKDAYTHLVDFTMKLYSEWVTCEESLNCLQSWTDRVFDMISKEKKRKYRSGPELTDFLNQYKVHKLILQVGN